MAILAFTSFIYENTVYDLCMFTIAVIVFFRADTRSEARSYNETIIRPVTRRLNTPAGTSYRSSRSHATTSEV